MFLALSGSPLPLAAEDAPPGVSWRVGLARAKSTPSEPVYLAGYASHRKPSTSGLSEIWFKALALEGGYQTRGVYYGGVGYFTSETEDVLADKVKELARRAGRE